MLALSRLRDESIVIGDDIKITVVDVRGDKVRLGIQAPREVPVHRSEVAEAIRRERAASDAAGEGRPTPIYGRAEHCGRPAPVCPKHEVAFPPDLPGCPECDREESAAGEGRTP